MARLLAKPLAGVQQPRNAYVIGFLFGLGFDTATTIGISAVSALFISFITLGGFFNAAFGLEDPVTTWLGGIDLGEAGLLLVACLLTGWGAAAVWGRLLASRRGI